MRSRPHWSYSSISQYLRCPLQYYFQRVLGLPTKSASSDLILGSAVHEALASYHLALQTSEFDSPSSITDRFCSAWKEREASEVVVYREGDTRDDCLNKGVHLLETYLREPPPERIVEIEREFLVPLYNSRGEYLETPLIAVTDLITKDENDILKVNEFKTSGRAYSESDVSTSLQPTCYAHAVHEHFGQEPIVDYVILVKTKTPKVQRLTTTRYLSDFGRLGDVVQAIDRAIDVGIFYPVESPMNCASCSFREHCRGWGKPVEQVEAVRQEVAAIEELACSPN
ncbi:PD-(D/E)XK nuclease family protein [Anatilimnocola floriformis]|uniref:PD-(D/E)XK nuclease family protein n=1 Tax=Anatilimnocola floriformis TaxID=2948575 RepID=UPI0020C1BADF|nr:PD-(D/E)XK nuclease family protein [Anatilimnocola floriformis]